MLCYVWYYSFSEDSAQIDTLATSSSLLIAQAKKSGTAKNAESKMRLRTSKAKNQPLAADK
jgi:hypothetical protein